mmetsp:Transcript_30039/g.61890  ORF Transcript_30039/g.61890 Transcript_30039/m.61890 type:complete len:232 (-) Transcript_30039:962-1657(-)
MITSIAFLSTNFPYNTLLDPHGSLVSTYTSFPSASLNSLCESNTTGLSNGLVRIISCLDNILNRSSTSSSPKAFKIAFEIVANALPSTGCANLPSSGLSFHPSSSSLSSSLFASSACTVCRCFEMALNKATTPLVAIRRWDRSASISLAMAMALASTVLMLPASVPSSSPSPSPSSSPSPLFLFVFSSRRLPILDSLFFFNFHSFSADIPALGANGNLMADKFSIRRFCRF